MKTKSINQTVMAALAVVTLLASVSSVAGLWAVTHLGGCLTDTLRSAKVLTELLLADNNARREETRQYGDNELRTVAKGLGMDPTQSRFPAAKRDRGQDESSLVIAVDHNACILCDRCIRGCNEVRHNEVIGRMGKGYTSRIAFDERWDPWPNEEEAREESRL